MAIKILVLIVLDIILILGNSFGERLNYCISCHRAHYLSYSRCEFCHRGISKTKRKQIAHYRLIPGDYAYFRLKESDFFKKGCMLVSKLGCRRCHMILAKGNNLATSLDQLPKNIEVKELTKNLTSPPEFMPYFSLTNYQIKCIINVIFNGIFECNRSDENFWVIHFDSSSNVNEFVKYCGSCHKVISKRYGPLGKGCVGPNLSGLFLNFFYSERGGWNQDKLIQWIKNPKTIDKSSLMPPISISDNSVSDIIKILSN